MFKFKNALALITELQNENELLKADILKQQSDLDYLSMMSNVELEQEENNDQI